MTDRLTIRTTLYSGDELYVELVDAIEWLSGLLEKVPAEFHDAARLEIELEKDYYGGPGSLYTKVYYDRPETDAEVQARIVHQKASEAQARAYNEARERQIYEQLKKKFG